MVARTASSPVHGAAGAKLPAGVNGPNGSSGPAGVSSPTGSSGPGVNGPTGSSVPTGVSGPAGVNGPVKVGARPEGPGPFLPQFYAGRSIFITGATGFMGKVLVERLLSTCPEVAQLYLLMRQKKDVPPEKRLLQLKQSQVFDNVRVRDPSQLDKLCIVPGDTALPDLGISADYMDLLQEVSIVFNSAATLKFDEPLKKAVEQNVRSAIRIMEICNRLPNIQALVHVSTAYSNAERVRVEERVYGAPVPLAELFTLADTVPDHILAQITSSYISPKPNTYTFTKALAESAVEQHRTDKYPVAIFRPTIVVSSLTSPFPGWIENLNGPSGVMVGMGKGLLHVFTNRRAARADLLPVDLAIDTLLAVGWETALDRLPEVRVYNCSSTENPTTWNAFHNAVHRSVRDMPMDDALWYPFTVTVENRFLYKIIEVLFQTVPLYLAEYTARIFGSKSKVNLITASQRLRAMNDVLTFFSLREWHFYTDNVQRLRARLSPRDLQIYNLDIHSVKWDDHYINFMKGVRKYLLKETDENLPEAKRRMERLRVIHYAVILVLFILFFRLLNFIVSTVFYKN